MRYLITGGAGYIGSNLVNDLFKEHNDIVIYPYLIRGGDIFFDSNFDYIIHLAANSNTMFPDDEEMVENNVESFKRILEFAKRTNIKLIYASSAAVYGNGCGPLNAYGHSKLFTDHIAEDNFNSMEIIGLRFFNVYGGKYESRKGKMASIITQWARQIQSGKTPVMFYNTRAERDFIYIKDVIKAIKLATTDALANGIYDVGTGVSTSFERVMDFVQLALGKFPHPIYISNPSPETYQVNTQAKLGWGFTPDYTIVTGIADYLKT